MMLAFGCADLSLECKVATSGYKPDIDAIR